MTFTFWGATLPSLHFPLTLLCWTLGVWDTFRYAISTHTYSFYNKGTVYHAALGYIRILWEFVVSRRSERGRGGT
jgi:hypothetical protein